MSVGMTANLVAYEALIVAHVLCTLSGEESDGIHVHGIRVVVMERQQSVSSRGNVHKSDIEELTSLGKPVLVHMSSAHFPKMSS